jgi:hypothetical protein
MDEDALSFSHGNVSSPLKVIGECIYSRGL